MRPFFAFMAVAAFVAVACKKANSPPANVAAEKPQPESTQPVSKGKVTKSDAEKKQATKNDPALPIRKKSGPALAGKSPQELLAERTVDQLIEDLDSDDARTRDMAAGEIFRRGKDAVLAARHVLKDATYGGPPDPKGFSQPANARTRAVLEAIPLMEDPEHPSKVLPAMRAAYGINPGKALMAQLPPAGSAADTAFLGSAVSLGLAKALESNDEVESAAAEEILCFLGTESVEAAMPQIGRWVAKSKNPDRSRFGFQFVFNPSACMPALVEILKSDSEPARNFVLKIFTGSFGPPNLGPRNPRNAQLLTPFLEDEKMRITIASAMFRLGEVERSLPILLNHRWPEAPESSPFPGKGKGPSPKGIKEDGKGGLPKEKIKGDGKGGSPVGSKEDGRIMPMFGENVSRGFYMSEPPELEKLLEILRKAIAGNDENQRKNAIRGLELMQQKGEVVWNELLKSNDESLKAHAVRNLQKLGKSPVAPPTIPSAPAADANQQEHIQYIQKIGEIQPATRQTMDILKGYLQDAKYTQNTWYWLPSEGPFAAESASLLARLPGVERSESMMRFLPTLPSDDPAVDAVILKSFIAPPQGPLGENRLVTKRVGRMPNAAPELMAALAMYPQRFDSFLWVFLDMNPPPTSIKADVEKRLDQSNTLIQDRLRILLMRIDPKLRSKYLPELVAKLKLPDATPPRSDSKLGPINPPGQPSAFDLVTRQYLLVLSLRKLDPKPKEIVGYLKELAMKYPGSTQGVALALLEIDATQIGFAMRILEDRTAAVALYPDRMGQMPSGFSEMAAFELNFDGQDILDAVAAGVTNTDPEARLSAVCILGSHAKTDNVPQQHESPNMNPGLRSSRLKRLEKSTSALKIALKDEDETVRTLAAAFLQPIDPKLAAISADNLRWAQQEIRIRQLRALLQRFPKLHYQEQNSIFNDMPYTSTEVVRELIPGLKQILLDTTQANWTQGTPVIQAFERVGADAVPALIEVIERGNFTNRRMAIEQLRKLGPGAAKAIPTLTRMLDDDYLSVRIYASMALTAIPDTVPPKAAKVLKDAFESANDPAEFGKLTILKEITGGKLGDEANALKRHARGMQMTMAPALVRADAANKQQYLALLFDSLREPNNLIQSNSAKSLRALGAQAKDLSPQIADRLKTEPQGPSRATLARVLRGIDIEAARKAGVR